MNTRMPLLIFFFRGYMAVAMLLASGIMPASAAEICSVVLTGAMQESIIVTDPDGVSTAPMPTAQGHVSIAPLTSVEVAVLVDGVYKYFFTGNGQYRMFWNQGADPSSVSVICRLDSVRTRAFQYDAVHTGEGFGAELLLTVGTAPTLSVDSNGDGIVDVVVAPDIAVTGTAANDSTPPVITHTRLPDGRHTLALIDNEQDITATGQLLYSLDDGSGYVIYSEPIVLDSRTAPQLLAIGRDLAGNRSDQLGFLTRNEDLPLCERLTAERNTVQNVVNSVLTQAVSDNLISASHGISMASIGPGACLWKRDEQGNDIACQTCEGRYAPVFDTQQILMLLPGAITDNTRDQLLERLRDSAASPQHDLTELLFVADDRAAFESGQRSTESGLAAQVQLLEWLLQAEYVDLGSTGPNVSGASLDSALASLRAASIPRLEGYEYSLQAEKELLETSLLVRIITMNAGMAATVPQLDPYLGRLLRNQLNTAANVSLRTAFGVLVADECAVDAGLATVSRQDFSTSACGGESCSSFAAYSLARVNASGTQCAGLFTSTELDALSELAAVVARDVDALSGVINDEWAANNMLAGALGSISGRQNQLVSEYENLMQALATDKPAEHAQRQANANAAQVRIAALESRPAVNLRFALVNTGTAEKTDSTILMYDNDSPNGQQLDLSPASETVLFFTGDSTSNLPFFIDIDPAVVEPNIVRNAGFVLRTPSVENAAVEGDTFGSMQYYLFDPEEPICPNPTSVERPDSGAGGCSVPDISLPLSC